MSTERGNGSRTRPQKHRNRTVFKNDLHDTSHTMKKINRIQVCEVCPRCRDIIEWKIKYKKYKPLTQPAKCVKCLEKTVRKAYHTACSKCASRLGVCAKCCQAKEAIIPEAPDELEAARLDAELKAELQALPERKRRTFLRYMAKGEKSDVKKDLLETLHKLKLQDGDAGDHFDDFDGDGGSETESN